MEGGLKALKGSWFGSDVLDSSLRNGLKTDRFLSMLGPRGKRDVPFLIETSPTDLCNPDPFEGLVTDLAPRSLGPAAPLVCGRQSVRPARV